MDRFVLTKWYFDSVDAGGRAAILYSTALNWGSARVGWHGVSICGPDQPVTHRASVRPMPLPERDGDRLAWRADPLGCTVDCTPSVLAVRTAPARPRPTASWSGAARRRRLEWMSRWRTRLRCLASATPNASPSHSCPGACRSTRCDGADGCRTMGRGRWCGSTGRARTRGRMPTWTAAPRPRRVVGDREVQAGGARLTMAPRRPLYSRSLGSALAGLGPVLKLLPASWRELEDAKWICRARLDGPGGRTR